MQQAFNLDISFLFSFHVNNIQSINQIKNKTSCLCLACIGRQSGYPHASWQTVLSSLLYLHVSPIVKSNPKWIQSKVREEFTLNIFS